MLPMSTPAEGFLADQKTHQNGRHHGNQGRNHHLLDGALGDDVHALAIFGFGGTFHDSRDLTELSADFFNNSTGSLAHGFHQQRPEVVGEQTTEKETDQDLGIGKVKGQSGAE